VTGVTAAEEQTGDTTVTFASPRWITTMFHHLPTANVFIAILVALMTMLAIVGNAMSSSEEPGTPAEEVTFTSAEAPSPLK